MVTIGQRKGLGLAGGTDPGEYVVDVDVTAEGDRRVMIGEGRSCGARDRTRVLALVGEPVDGSLDSVLSSRTSRVRPDRGRPSGRLG